MTYDQFIEAGAHFYCNYTATSDPFGGAWSFEESEQYAKMVLDWFLESEEVIFGDGDYSWNNVEEFYTEVDIIYWDNYSKNC